MAVTDLQLACFNYLSCDRYIYRNPLGVYMADKTETTLSLAEKNRMKVYCWDCEQTVFINRYSNEGYTRCCRCGMDMKEAIR